MSSQELIRLYSEGLLARRDFIRRLTLAGVSAGAAAGYATSLAPSAGAAVRPLAVQQDEYGGPIDPEDLDEAIAATIELIQALVDFLQTALDLFSPEDFADFLAGGTLDVLEQLTTLLAQLEAERATLDSASASVAAVALAPAKRRLAATARLIQSESPDQFVADLGDVLDVQCQLYAGLIAAAEDAELRGELASLAIVKGEQAAFVRILRGLPPFPNDLETAIDAEDAREQIEAILA